MIDGGLLISADVGLSGTNRCKGHVGNALCSSDSLPDVGCRTCHEALSWTKRHGYAGFTSADRVF